MSANDTLGIQLEKRGLGAAVHAYEYMLGDMSSKDAMRAAIRAYEAWVNNTESGDAAASREGAISQWNTRADNPSDLQAELDAVPPDHSVRLEFEPDPAERGGAHPWVVSVGRPVRGGMRLEHFGDGQTAAEALYRARCEAGLTATGKSANAPEGGE